MNGWIKIHRALAKHHVASDPHSFSVWMHLLMLANHSQAKQLINGRVLTIMPGQLITSRKSLAEKTGVQESKVERVLKMLETEQQIEQHGTSKYRVISIVNWHLYQCGEQQNDPQMNSKRTADEQQMNTLEEVSISPSGDTDTQEGKKVKTKALVPSADDTSDYTADFEAFWSGYPKRHGANPKKGAFKAWKARLRAGISADDLIQSAACYADQMRSTGKFGTEFVKQAASFLGPDDHWREALNAQPAQSNLDEGNCPVDKIIDLYHRECSNLPPVAVPSDTVLRTLIVERWNESEDHQASTFWRTIFGRANRLQQIYYRGNNVIPRLELICSRGTFRLLEEQV